MKKIIGKNIGCIMSKWYIKAEGLMEFFPAIEFSSATFSGWRTGRNLPPFEFILTLSDITGLSAQTLCRKVISESDLPKQPILDKPYQQPELKSIMVTEPLLEYFKIPSILKRLDRIEDELKLKDE